MADRFPAQIWIGGKVSNTERLYPDDEGDTTTTLQGLIAALNADGASHEYGDKEIDASIATLSDPWDELAPYLDDSGLLHLKCDQAIDGEFPETEQFCLDNAIGFDRNSDHYCEYDAENCHYRPGMSGVVMTHADSSGHEVVDGECVRKGLALIEKFNYDISYRSDWAKLDEGLRYLRDVCPELPPPLEKFEIKGLTFVPCLGRPALF